MRKIINGKKYDTNTATACGGYEYGWGGDFNHIYEELYRKKTGEFFLYGVGGAFTKYCTECGPSSYTGGEDITPLTEKEAREWAEEYLDYDEYVKAFGEPAE